MKKNIGKKLAMNKLSSILKIVSFGVVSFAFLSVNAKEPADAVTEGQYNSDLIGTQCRFGSLTKTTEMNIDNTTSSCNHDCQKMVAKEPMQADGIVRLSRIEVYPQHLDEYIRFATEVGEVSLRTEPGVLTMYAVAEKDNPCIITILETYSSQEAYRKHIASAHFQKYKQGTLHMVKSLVLSDQTPLNPANQIKNFIK